MRPEPESWAPWLDITPGPGAEQYARAFAIGAAGPGAPNDEHETIEAKGAAVIAPSGGGGLLLEVGPCRDRYIVQSSFSYPQRLGMQQNWLAFQPWPTGEPVAWEPTVARDGDALVVTAKGATYALERRIVASGDRVEITDSITNLTSDIIGLAVSHSILPVGQPKHVRLSGLDPTNPAAPTPSPGQFPENPTIFTALAATGVGLVAEDDAMRLESAASQSDNAVSFGTTMLGIAAGETYRLRWALYPGGPDYFEFINKLRRDWGVNFTVEGPWDFFNVESLYTTQAKEAAKKLLERKRMKIFALTPWFEYYNYWGLNRDLYRRRIKEGMDFLRGIVPDAKFIACFETNLTPVPLSFFLLPIPCWWKIGRQNGGKYGQPASLCMNFRIKNSVWADSVVYDEKGRALLDAYYVQYYTDPKALNLIVYPMKKGGKTNHRYRQGVEQLTWLLDEVGFDGIYFDQFSIAMGYLAAGVKDRYTYNVWDGQTVTLDGEGNVSRTFADCTFLSAEARRSWVELVLSRGKIPVCNTNPAVSELQSLPTFRFMETQGYEPLTGSAPYSYPFVKGQLGSPLALGTSFFEMTMPSAETWNRAVIAGLRFGLLSYYYFTDFPSDGPFGGEYGPMNHFFPFTPVELHEGWVLGKERLVTCVSGEFFWPHKAQPTILQFDRFGRERPATAEVNAVEGGHRVQIKLDDWWEIAVVKDVVLP